MGKKHEVVVIGGGHNGLTVACYLAKAGVDVCVLESMPYVGGCVISPELAAPGFKTDICAVWHGFIQPNPLILNDELELKSKFGLKYIFPENQFCALFPDDSYINVYRDVDATCASIAKFSQRDAQAYKKFHHWGASCLEMLVHGLYNPPIPFGSMVAMLDQSYEGRSLLRALMVSALDICEEWFESPELKTTLTKYAAEAVVSPHTKGTGFVLFVLIPLIHKYGGAIPEGGSGVLSEAMAKCILYNGGTILTKHEVEKVIVTGGETRGVILKGGEEIVATKAVISSLNAKQIPDLIGINSLPENYVKGLNNLMFSSFGAVGQGYALNEPPNFTAGDEVNTAFNVEFASTPYEKYLRAFYDLEHGYPCVDMPAVVCQTRFDLTRAPQGKHTMDLFHYAPHCLADEGIAKWDEIREEIADKILGTLQKQTTNMSSDNIIGRAIETPLDLLRRDSATIVGDYNHLGMFLSQIMGNRYLPGWHYQTPIKKFWICGPSCHPGGGVMGGGRAAVQPVMEDLGIDFEKVIS